MDSVIRKDKFDKICLLLCRMEDIMEGWKYNGRRGSYWKKEEAMLKMSKKTEVYKDFDKNSCVVRTLPKDSKVIYREIILVNQHLWVECSGTSETFYIPLRRWNGSTTNSKKYKLGELQHTIIEIGRKKKSMKKDTKNGVDIYIDNDKEIIYVSMNQKMTPESHRRLKESINLIKGYQV